MHEPVMVAEVLEHLRDVVLDAFQCGKPAVIEVPIDPDEFPVPATGGRRD